MCQLKKLNVKQISHEICEVLSKHQVPVAALEQVFGCVRKAASNQAVIPVEYSRYGNRVAQTVNGGYQPQSNKKAPHTPIGGPTPKKY